MILGDNAILQEMVNGNIIIDPFNEKHINPNSVDLTLAPEMKVYPKKWMTASVLPDYIKHNGSYKMLQTGEGNLYQWEEPLDVKKPQNPITLKIGEEGYVLNPNEVYLYACNERIGVKNNIRAKVEGKSSLGRLGLFVHVTAGFIDTGFEGSLVLELVATRPIRIYPNMKICQVEFARVEGEILETYDQKAGSKYMNQTGVQHSLYQKNYTA
jgi:dCTP deaminase